MLFRSTQSSEALYQQRTSLGYVLNQLRRGDALGVLSVGSFGEGDALFLQEGDYQTTLYLYDGYLRELYATPEDGLSPEDGLPILPLSSFSLTPAQGVLVVEANGYTAIHAPRSPDWEVTP